MRYCQLCDREIIHGTVHGVCLKMEQQGYKLVDNCYGITGGDKWVKPDGSYAVTKAEPND